MKIGRVEAFVLKLDKHYQIRGHQETPNRIPETDYYFEPEHRHVYSRKLETCLVKITSDTELVGWGEANAPITPETPASIITNLLGPALLGKDPRAVEHHYETLTHMMHVRGHGTGFMIDAIAAIDTALWDLKGQEARVPIHELLGSAQRKMLPAYVSGLRAPTLETRCKAAQQCQEEGFHGIKVFLGSTLTEDIQEIEALRKAVGPEYPIYVDALWKYSLPEAMQLGRSLDEHSVAWLEAPLGPFDLSGHTQLAAAIDTRIAVGEGMRSVAEFQPWFEAGALDVAQPDVTRCGITEAKRIAALAAEFGRPVAYHLGVGTAVGMAATWHLAATTPNLEVQEYQHQLAETANQILMSPLSVVQGELVVPSENGLGIQVRETSSFSRSV